MNTKTIKEMNERRRSRLESDSFWERGGLLLILAIADAVIYIYLLYLLVR